MNDTKALAWIRTSTGTESDIGLQQQREEIPALAETLTDDVDVLDLGVHTGFSRLSSDRLPMKDEFIDTNPEVQDAVERIRAGAYDYIVAWDDTRVARDEYFHVIEHAAAVGDAEFRYVADVPEDDMVASITRIVELSVKLREMEKAQHAKLKRQKQDLPDGRPPFGLQYNAEKTALVPDENYEAAQEILRLDDDGESQRGIARQVEPSRSTVRRVLESRDLYRDAEDDADAVVTEVEA